MKVRKRQRRRPHIPPEIDALFRAINAKKMVFATGDGEIETVPLDQRERGRPAHWEADFAAWSSALLVWARNPGLRSLRSLLLKITDEASNIRQMERAIARLRLSRFIGVIADLTVSPPLVIASQQRIFPLLHFQPLGLLIHISDPWYGTGERPSSRGPGARYARQIEIGLQAESMEEAQKGALLIDAAQREAITSRGTFVLVLDADGLQILRPPKFLGANAHRFNVVDPGQ